MGKVAKLTQGIHLEHVWNTFAWNKMPGLDAFPWQTLCFVDMALSIGQLPLSTGMSLIGKRARWPTFPSVVSFEALDKRSRKGDNLPASASASFL